VGSPGWYSRRVVYIVHNFHLAIPSRMELVIQIRILSMDEVAYRERLDYDKTTSPLPLWPSPAEVAF